MLIHLITALCVSLWVVFTGFIDLVALRLLRDEPLPEIEIGHYREPDAFPIRTLGAIAIVVATTASLFADSLQGAAVGVTLGTLLTAAVRDSRDHLLWPELFTIALPVELLLRVLDGHAYDAALGLSCFAIVAWVIIFSLQAMRVPQGFGDLLPAFLLGASFPILAGVSGLAIGFLTYAIFVFLTRRQSITGRIVPVGPAFALTAIIASVLILNHVYS
jgi:hypothetical protein